MSCRGFFSLAIFLTFCLFNRLIMFLFDSGSQALNPHCSFFSHDCYRFLTVLLLFSRLVLICISVVFCFAFLSYFNHTDECEYMKIHIFRLSFRNCLSCVYNCDDHSIHIVVFELLSCFALVSSYNFVSVFLYYF